MIDDDMHLLDERSLERSLGSLEADIWRGVAARETRRKAARRTASFQGVIMLFAVLGSVAAGIDAAGLLTAPTAISQLAPGMELMPSHLLVGHRP